MEKTNFDIYLEQQLEDPKFVERFERADAVWTVAIEAARFAEIDQQSN